MRVSALFLCATALCLCGCQGNSDTGAKAGGNAAEGSETGGGVSGGTAPVSTSGGNESAPEKVEFQGCPRIVKVSKPAGCLVVKSGGETYDIDSAQPRPDPGRLIIQGTGTYSSDTVGICMTGKILTNVKWHYTKSKCPVVDEKGEK